VQVNYHVQTIYRIQLKISGLISVAWQLIVGHQWRNCRFLLWLI